jgi:hypothetical protein
LAFDKNLSDILKKIYIREEEKYKQNPVFYYERYCI